MQVKCLWRLVTFRQGFRNAVFTDAIQGLLQQSQ